MDQNTDQEPKETSDEEKRLVRVNRAFDALWFAAGVIPQ